MRKLFNLLLLGLATSSTYAGGYRVSLQGQKALAMGHTGVAVVNSAELAFFNPSGMVWLENKLNVSAGATGVFATTKYQNVDTQEEFQTESNVGTPFYLNATYKINDWLSAGLAVNTPFGSKVEWPTDWAGSNLVNNIELAAVFVNPTVSVKVTPEFSIGGGPIYVNGGVNFNRNLQDPVTGIVSQNPNGRSNVTLDATGVSSWGWNASAMFKPSDNVTLGVNYRSHIDLEVTEGEADFENTGAFEDTTFTASLPLPAELNFGASVQFCEKWLVTAQIDRTYWGRYESLDVYFNSDAPDSINPRNYENTTTYRFGSQYDFKDNIVLRAGYYFDESPVASGFFSPETPRNDSHGFTAGLSYDITEKLTVDASFLYLYFDEIDESYDASSDDMIDSFEGSYVSNVFAPGIGLTYKM